MSFQFWQRIQCLIYLLWKESESVMVNNSTNINKWKITPHPKSLNIEKKNHDIWCWKSRSWLGTGTAWFIQKATNYISDMNFISCTSLTIYLRFYITWNIIDSFRKGTILGEDSMLNLSVMKRKWISDGQ
jgi:hypothetical protein